MLRPRSRSSAGEPGVGTHLVRRLPGAELLLEERANPGDAHAYAVPLPQLAGRGHSGLHSAPAGLPQVSAFEKLGNACWSRAGAGEAAREAPRTRGGRRRGRRELDSPTISQPTSSSGAQSPGAYPQTSSRPLLDTRKPGLVFCLAVTILPLPWSSSVSAVSLMFCRLHFRPPFFPACISVYLFLFHPLPPIRAHLISASFPLSAPAS